MPPETSSTSASSPNEYAISLIQLVDDMTDVDGRLRD